jgi:GT2 family glycosyltransferase
MTRRASVVIPTYNRAELLRQTLTALTRQRDARPEVIVVDDGSSDHTEEVVAGFRDRLDVRYLFQPDEGFRAAEARNVGVRAAEGEICVFLDCGMLPATDFVARHLAAHDATADRLAVVGYAWAYRADRPVEPAVLSAIDPDDVDSSIGRLRGIRDARDIRDDFFYDKFGDDLGAEPAPWVTFWACNLSVRRSDLFVVNLFDESFRGWGFEDLDLGYRLFRSGVRFALARDAQAVHALHERDVDGGQHSDFENKRHFHEKFRNRVSELALGTPHNLQINGMLRAEMSAV